MNCQDIQELLLTDYADDQLDPEEKNKVGLHLEGCSVCRDFRGAVIKAEAVITEAPLMQGPAPHVWDRICQDIQSPPKSFWDEIRAGWRSLFGGFRPVWAYGSFVAVMLVVVVVAQPLVHRQQTALVSDDEYILQLVYADDDVVGGADSDLAGSGFVVDQLL